MTTRRTTTLLASAVLVGALALGPTPAGGQAVPCEEPYSPVAFAESYPAQEELPAVDATPVPTTPVGSPLAFDSDGDGVDDTVARGPDGVTISRGDGDVVLTSSGGADATGVGDVDGDGRDEIQVRTTGDVFLVPGTVAPGTTPAADAGTRMPFGATGIVFPDDGWDRLVVLRPEGNSIPETITDVLDASDVTALGPGGDAGTLTPTVTVPGQVRFTADLGSGPSLLVSGRSIAGGGEEGRVDLFLVDSTDVVELTTRPERYQPEYVAPYGVVEVLDGPDGTFVTLLQTSRNGSARYMWSLDDPCTPLAEGPDPDPPSTPSTPTAPAARPVATAARFTG